MSDLPLIIVDGNNQVCRFYFAAGPEATMALWRALFTDMTTKAAFLPSNYQTAVIFDGEDNTAPLVEGYKAQREEKPEDLLKLIVEAEEWVRRRGLPVLKVDDIEGDQVVAGVATWASQAGRRVYILSNDKDFLQLVRDEDPVVSVIRPQDGNYVHFQSDDVVKKFGIPPTQVADYLAMVGDSSDNLKGVKGIGPVAAVKLLKQFGSVKGIINHSGEVPGAVGVKLNAGLETLVATYKMVKLRPKPLPLPQVEPLNRNRLARLPS